MDYRGTHTLSLVKMIDAAVRERSTELEPMRQELNRRINSPSESKDTLKIMAWWTAAKISEDDDIAQ